MVNQEFIMEFDHLGWIGVDVVWEVDIGFGVSKVAIAPISASAFVGGPENANQVVTFDSVVVGDVEVFLKWFTPVDVSPWGKAPRLLWFKGWWLPVCPDILRCCLV